ncbi:hypothetical protein SAY87_029726 [Trapa incisa]|uniref:Neprosin PEP catalytic domain-containing protein n=1 Tax=Trapa incisa TaxID=236973 RepID=A0AAN7KDG1_9MYRT|nr:hypothetical protein SAY87_029726 [Trapa incisa]
MGHALLVHSVISPAKLLDSEERTSHNLSSGHRHAVRSIRSEDGDVIDCINIYKQPAFDHPALRNHAIQMAPSVDPSVERTMSTEKSPAAQLWRRSGSCPIDTVPVRRSKKASGTRRFPARKKPTGTSKSSLRSAPTDEGDKVPNLLRVNRSVAILFTYGYNYNAAKGDIRVWNPYVEHDHEWSNSQVALQNGPYHHFESVESGWAVNPSLYGDRQTRFFVYWTVDASKTTGCFDLTCPGFVQTNQEIAIGAAIYPISTPDGLPYQITIYIFKDMITSNFWVQYNGVNVGYWPADLFTSLKLTVETVQWGGEVYSSKVGGGAAATPHTATQMGSGQFPEYMEDVSGWVKRLRVRDNSMTLKAPDWAGTYSDEYRCYNVRYVTDYVEDPEFYYGGPGRGFLCP